MEVDGQIHAQTVLSRKNILSHPLNEILCGPQDQSGRCGIEKSSLAPCRESNPDCRACSPSLYQLSYITRNVIIIIILISKYPWSLLDTETKERRVKHCDTRILNIDRSCENYEHFRRTRKMRKKDEKKEEIKYRNEELINHGDYKCKSYLNPNSG